MALETNLSRSPYFDDYNANSNFYRILYRPSVAVQTRELNQMQTILQDQIEKFGRNIFKDGSVVEGCSFSFDDKYNYVKIKDTYANSSAFTVTDFQDKLVTNQNGLQAIVVNTVGGFEAQDPDLNTLYIKYLNTGTFPNSSPQSIYANNDTLTVTTQANVVIGDITVAPVADSAGVGYAFSTTDGVIFKNGFFINVYPQTKIISKYDNQPDNISVGFEAEEFIVTPESDSTLYDNAAGAPNYQAPGAHRFKIIPQLITVQTDAVSGAIPFLSLCDFKNGKPVSIKSDPQYAIIGAEMAKRTYETNGDYVVTPFILSTETKPSIDPNYQNFNNLVSSRGLGYVKGYRVEYLNNNYISIRKGLDFESFTDKVVTANFGAYLTVNQYSGDFGTDTVQQVELHNVFRNSISNATFLSTTYSSATKIGTAYLRGFVYDSGNIGTGSDSYRAYLFNIQMNPGSNFSDVKSIINYQSPNLQAVADVIQTPIYNSVTATTSNTTVLQQPVYSKLIYPIGQKAIKSDAFDNASFVYRDRVQATFSNVISGQMVISLPASPKGTGVEQLNSVSPSGLSNAEKTNFIVVPTAGGRSTNKTGTVGVTSGQANVTGTTTTFLTDYYAGDYITINGQTRLVTSITNNTVLNVNKTWGSSAVANIHWKTFPAGVPINFSLGSRSITSTSNTITYTLNEALNASFNANAYFDVLRTQTVPQKKNLIKNFHVKLNPGTSSPAYPNIVGWNKYSGPWSLGVSDAYKINAIYVTSNGTYSNTGIDRKGLFQFDNGQRDSYYGLATLSNIGMTLNANSRIVIDMDLFDHDQSQGVGFFNANSYPIDDANTANTNAIQTQFIPQYTATDGTGVFDLRDSIDFRPFAANTANLLANTGNWSGSATENPSSTLTFYVDPVYGSYIPSPDTNYQSDMAHYLPRRDKIILKTSGELATIEGKPSQRPSAPMDQPTSMTLGILDVPPYPSLSTQDAKNSERYDYAMTITTTQNKRFTMRDIGVVANRVDNLEYYTSLSLLEKNAKDMLVRSGLSGQNRFQNGILVDPFAGHDIGDTQDPTYNIGIDKEKTELRPAFKEYTKHVWSNTTPSLIETNYISEAYASVGIPCVGPKTYNWRGRIEFLPKRIHHHEFCRSPHVITNLHLNSHFVNIYPDWDNYVKVGVHGWREPYGCDYGHWRVINPRSLKGLNPKNTSGDGKTDIYGNIINNYTSRDVDNLNSLSDTVGKTLNTSTNTEKYTYEDYVMEVALLHKVRHHEVAFIARGLKPNTRVYAFINNVNANKWVRQLTNPSGWHDWHPRWSKKFGQPLITDARGHLYGKLHIPHNKFKQSTIKMLLVDVDDPVLKATSITTTAVGTLFTHHKHKHHDRHDYVDDCNRDDTAAIHLIVKSYNDNDAVSPTVYIEDVDRPGDDDVYPKDKSGNVVYPLTKPDVAQDDNDSEPKHRVQDGFRKSTHTHKVGQNAKHHY